MRDLFECEIGLSDHTAGIGVALAAVALGASVVEKHFTLRRADGGVDSEFSLEPDELRALVVESERAAKAPGKITYGPSESEKPSLQFRRTLYVVEAMKAGDVLTEKNLRSIRPGLGISPANLNLALGKKVNRDIERGTPFHWDLIG